MPVFVHFSLLRITWTPPSRGARFFVLRPAVSGFLDLLRYTGAYSPVKNTFSVVQTHTLNRAFGNTREIAVNRDGSKIFLHRHLQQLLFKKNEHRSASSYRWSVFALTGPCRGRALMTRSLLEKMSITPISLSNSSVSPRYYCRCCLDQCAEAVVAYCVPSYFPPVKDTYPKVDPLTRGIKYLPIWSGIAVV